MTLWHFIVDPTAEVVTACGLAYGEPEWPRGSNRPELTTCPACITAQTNCKGAQS